MPFPYLGDLLNPRIEPGSPALQADSLPPELPGKQVTSYSTCLTLSDLSQQNVLKVHPFVENGSFFPDFPAFLMAPLCIYTRSFLIHSSINGPWVVSMSWLLQIVLQ